MLFEVPAMIAGCPYGGVGDGGSLKLKAHAGF
jgi:hypothetical protein